MLKIYYAHPMSWYGSLNEDYDVRLLEHHGEVINPNSEPFDYMVQVAKKNGKDVMSEVFLPYVRDMADVVAYRSFKDGRIGAGVAQEVIVARIWGKPVWEVRNTSVIKNPEVRDQFDFYLGFSLGNILSIEETRARIQKGQL